MKAGQQKKKGARFENHLQGVFRERIDTDAHVNKGSGAGLNKGDLRIPSCNIVIEAKNAKQVTLIKDWEQAKAQALGDDLPVLAIRNPKKAEFEETLIIISLEHFTELLRGEMGELKVEESLSYEKKSAIQGLKSAISRVNKEFNI